MSLRGLLLILVVCGCSSEELQSPTTVPVPKAKPPVTTPAPVITHIIEKQITGDWYLYTQSYGGVVSINQGLTEVRCRQLLVLALPKSDFIDATGLTPKPAEGNIRTAECRQ